MKEKAILTEDILTELDDITREVIDYAVPLAQGLASLHEDRLARLERLAKLLKADKQKKSPEVAAEILVIAESAAQAKKLSSEAKTIASRQASAPRLKANEWLVAGNISSPDGKPLTKARVRVFDRDRKFDDLLGETKTDAQGDFSITYRARDFAKFGEVQPELFVRVEDAQGKLLHATKEKIGFKAGGVEYFEIVIEDSGKETKPIAAVKSSRKKR